MMVQNDINETEISSIVLIDMLYYNQSIYLKTRLNEI